MNMITRSGAAVGALLLLSAVSQAADLEAVPAAHDWTGFYVGANAGGAWNNSNFNADATGPLVGSFLEDRFEFDQGAFTGGLMLGYNWQVDQVVFGLEGDLGYLGFDQDNEASGIAGATAASIRTNMTTDWFGTMRGRLGYAADSFLIYATGGGAFANVNVDGRVNVGADQWSGSNSNVNWGWTIGGGVEYAFDESWSIGAEYLYVDLGSNDDWDTDGNAGNAIASTISSNSDTAFSLVRATVKVKF